MHAITSGLDLREPLTRVATLMFLIIPHPPLNNKGALRLLSGEATSSSLVTEWLRAPLPVGKRRPRRLLENDCVHLFPKRWQPADRSPSLHSIAVHAAIPRFAYCCYHTFQPLEIWPTELISYKRRGRRFPTLKSQLRAPLPVGKRRPRRLLQNDCVHRFPCAPPAACQPLGNLARGALFLQAARTPLPHSKEPTACTSTRAWVRTTRVTALRNR